MRTALPFLVLLSLAACKPDDGKLPQGQVVATIDGVEITLAELQLEIRNAGPDLEIGKSGQLALIKALAARKLLVRATKERKLDITPEASLVRNRARDLALVDLLQRNIIPPRPRASEAELTKFVDNHPTMFTSRELITVDQIVMQGRAAGLVDQLHQARNMVNVERVLSDQNIGHLRSYQTLDTLYLSFPDATALQNAGSNPIVLQDPLQPLRIVQVKARVAAPLAGDEALTAARAVLQSQHDNEVKKALQSVIAAGKKNVTRNVGAGALGAK